MSANLGLVYCSPANIHPLVSNQLRASRGLDMGLLNVKLESASDRGSNCGDSLPWLPRIDARVLPLFDLFMC